MPLNTNFAPNTSAPEDRTATGVNALKYALPPKPNIFRIIIADRLPVLARGLCAILSDIANFEASSHPFLNERDLTEICGIRPDILILDPSQTTLLPSTLMQHLGQSQNRPALIGFCNSVSLDLARNCIDAGFRGFLAKTAPVDQIVRALRVVCEGGVYLDDVNAKAMVGARQSTGRGYNNRATLSEREEHVLKAFAYGQSLKEIAGTLHLSPKTVDTYKTRAGRKLGLNSRPDFVRHAIRMGWMQAAAF